jgi:hypothetical protein
MHTQISLKIWTMAELVTYGFIFSKNNKDLKTFSTYDVEDEYLVVEIYFQEDVLKN